MKLSQPRLSKFAKTMHILVLSSVLARLIYGISAMLVLSTSTSAFAEGPGWTNNSTVKKLVVTANGGVNVLLSPPLTNCVSQSGYGPAFASIYPTHPGINRMKADLLAAYLNGAGVALYLGDNSCTVQEMILGGW